MDNVLDLLRSDDRLSDWIDHLETIDGPDVEVELPSSEDLPAVLVDLAVPHEDVNDLVEQGDVVAGNRELWWLLERTVRALVQDMGTIRARLGLLPLPEAVGAAGRFFHVLVLVAVLPHVQRYHDALGIPASVSRRSLADLGRQMAVHRRRRGTGGLLVPRWLELHFRGELYQLGRLQFQRTRLDDRTGRGVAAGGASAGPGDPCLEIHIPDFCGPLTPSACEQSLAHARRFFPRHFPDDGHTVATCHSWLLDPQLGDYLAEGSNIVEFQRRFHPGHCETEYDDTGPVGFVFGDPELAADALPRRTTLERAIADHLLAGGHWRNGHGWIEL